MFKTLRSRLVGHFVILSLISILLMSMAFRFSFEDCFAIYLDNQRNDEIERFVSTLKGEISKSPSIINEEKALQEKKAVDTLISYQAMTGGLFYEVYNESGEVLLDSTDLIDMISDLLSDEDSRVIESLELESETRILELDGEEIGTIVIHYNIGYQKGEFQFKDRLNRYIVIAEIIMVLIAFILSFFFSQRLTVGLTQIRNAAQELVKHNLNVRMPVKKNLSAEIKEVAVTVNELAESLSYQENLRKQFSSDLAHEFRTPIATLRSIIEAFQDKVWDPTPERLDQCHNELMRLVHLVDELEQLMIAENPTIQLNIKPINAKYYAQEIEKYFTWTFEQKGIEFSVNQIDDEVYFKADYERLNQIFTNLLNNSFKYTHEGGNVTVSLSQKGQFIQFIIADNGIGISKEDLPHVFERFYRGDKSRQRKTGGVGIGLSIVKALVHAQKGSIIIDSELGKGTKVILSFPVDKENR